MSRGLNLLGLSLSTLDAKLSDVELAAAPPVRPADDCVLLPAQLHNQEVSDIRVSGDEEGKSGIAIQLRPTRLKEEKCSDLKLLFMEQHCDKLCFTLFNPHI